MKFNQLFTTIDVHTGGEPLRIITGGIPPLQGESILEKRAFFRNNLDYIRQTLMFEPRGHHGMYGCVLTPPVSSEADFGVLFMHNEGYSTMCGHGIIAVVTAVIETGWFRVQGTTPKIVIDSPAGLITAYAKCEGANVKSVSFENVPSFVLASSVPLSLGGKYFTVDIAYGGAFYAIVNAEDIGVRTDIEQLAELQRWGAEIKAEIERTMVVEHPNEKEINGIYGVIISDQPRKADSHLRNITIFANEQIDRSPCGTGTAARVASLYQRGQLKMTAPFIHEGILDSQFTARITKTTTVGKYEAIIPTIEGKAYLTGFHQFVVDPTDPLADGFLLQ